MWFEKHKNLWNLCLIARVVPQNISVTLAVKIMTKSVVTTDGLRNTERLSINYRIFQKYERITEPLIYTGPSMNCKQSSEHYIYPWKHILKKV